VFYLKVRGCSDKSEITMISGVLGRASFWLGPAALATALCVSGGTANALSFYVDPANSLSLLPSNFGTFSPCNCNVLQGSDGLFIGSGNGNGSSASNPFSQFTIFSSSSPVNTGLEVLGTAPNSTVGVAITYLGYEAGDTNLSQDMFSYDPTNPPVTFNNKSTAPGTVGLASLTLGNGPNPILVPFNFHSIDAGTTATNGGPITPGSSLGFMLDPNNALIAYAFFDDSGAGPDSDFDDMVVELQLIPGQAPSPTPLPATLPLLAGGLGIIGLLGARKRRNARAA
jgi:hypothetical protein